MLPICANETIPEMYPLPYKYFSGFNSIYWICAIGPHRMPTQPLRYPHKGLFIPRGNRSATTALRAEQGKYTRLLLAPKILLPKHLNSGKSSRNAFGRPAISQSPSLAMNNGSHRCSSPRRRIA